MSLTSMEPWQSGSNWSNTTHVSPLKSAYSLVYAAAKRLDSAGVSNGTSQVSWSPLPAEQHFIDSNGLGVDRRGDFGHEGRKSVLSSKEIKPVKNAYRKSSFYISGGNGNN